MTHATRWARTLVAASCFAGFTALAGDDPLVAIEFDAPQDNDGLPILTEGGWPMNLTMKVDSEELAGITAYNAGFGGRFPGAGDFGGLVFADPDGCLVFPNTGFGYNFFDPDCPESPQASSDEIYMGFFPDVDQPGVEDLNGYATSVGSDPARRVYLADDASSGGDELKKYPDPFDSDGTCVPGTDDRGDCYFSGPFTGDGVDDGYGIGADDDAMSLVVLSPTGVGIKYPEPGFTLTGPLTLRNLAGLSTSTAYELSTVKAFQGKGKKAGDERFDVIVRTHFNMPSQLIQPLIAVDVCVGTIIDASNVVCSDTIQWQVDGGAIEDVPVEFRGSGDGTTGRADAIAQAYFDSLTVPITAVIVSGLAPDELSDEDGDGDVDADDATLAGYLVLSNTAETEVAFSANPVCLGGGGGSFYKDLDANGLAVPDSSVCPAGPGDLRPPPR